MVLVWGYSKHGQYYLGILTKLIPEAMAFDFVILLLCTYRLASHRMSTLGHLLLRDGIVRSRLTLCAGIILFTFVYSSSGLFLCRLCREFGSDCHGWPSHEPCHEHHHPTIRSRCFCYCSHHRIPQRLHCVR